MKMSIFGLLIGTGLLGTGFTYHDEDVSTNTLFYQRYSKDRVSEDRAYAIGMVGAAITAISIKSILNKIEPDKPCPIKKFRLTCQFLLGTGMAASGVGLHEIGGPHDYLPSWEFSEDGAWRQRVSYEENYKEHMGYGIGAVGSALIGLTIKEIWDNRRKEKAPPMNEAYKKFRLHLRSPTKIR